MASTAFPSRDDFAAMLNESLGGENETFEGKVVTGTITAIENDLAVIDVGLKSEGRVPLREFAMPGQKADLKVGDTVEVYVDRVENAAGEAMLSRDRARREAAWDKLEKEYDRARRVSDLRPGQNCFTVDLGSDRFLPGNQVDIRPVRDVGPLMDIPQRQILKMDRRRGNIVVSRRHPRETRAEQRSGLIQNCRARSSERGQRTSPIMARSLIWAASTACCTSPTSATSASSTRARSSASATRSRCRSSASTARLSAFRWA
jgi:small subunit ribosomal protein S1